MSHFGVPGHAAVFHATHVAHGGATGSIINAIVSGAAHSIGWHVVSALFRGAGFIQGLLIGVVLLVLCIVVRALLRRVGIV